uniref:Cystinosin-like protein n=1 Tax=Auxenochlorella protothecoides TaxID=3075 RepID=A0A1D2A396_AUXPR
MSTKPLLPGVERDVPLTTRLSYALKHQWAVWLGVPVAMGLIVGLSLPSNPELPAPLNIVSPIIGWTYFAAWSVSFYPQVWLNYTRKSVSGLSLDFQILNLLGFVCYAVYNVSLYWNAAIREAYRLVHGGNSPAVHANDVFFALHAAVLTMVTLAQSLAYPSSRTPPSRLCVAAVVATSGAVLAYAAALYWAPGLHPSCLNGCTEGTWFTWLNLLYLVSLVKLAVSLVKYIPQVILNHRLRSTRGWNVWNVLLDFEGGALSLAQMIIDNSVCGDWSAVTGNPVKFALGFVSMFFDVIFVGQHVAFGKRRGVQDAEGEEGSGLLPVSDEAQPANV